MKVEWLNEGAPFPAGHRKAGQVGVLIDFEDGRPEPQMVYAADAAAMALKIGQMYGNTNVRLQEVKTAAPAPPQTPATPPAAQPPAPRGKMTADERMQAVADMADPAKVDGAMKKLLAENGFDIDAENRKKAEAAELDRKKAVTGQFIDEHPDWYGTKANATLLRDRTFARVGANFSANDLHESYMELLDMGVLEQAQQQEQHQQEETPQRTEEPLAPTPARRVSTGARSSGQGARPTPVQAGGQQLTRAYIEGIAGTEEYARRLRDEPGFQAKVEAALR